jgi:hypothetical protein
VEETTAAAESLSTEADHLKENMGFFKTGLTVTPSRYGSPKPAARPASPVAKVGKANKGLPSPSSTNNEWNDF